MASLTFGLHRELALDIGLAAAVAELLVEREAAGEVEIRRTALILALHKIEGITGSHGALDRNVWCERSSWYAITPQMDGACGVGGA
jgi:hypothetical protein